MIGIIFFSFVFFANGSVSSSLHFIYLRYKHASDELERSTNTI